MFTSGHEEDTSRNCRILVYSFKLAIEFAVVCKVEVVPFTVGSYFVSSSTPFVKFTNGYINNPGEFSFTNSLEIPSQGKTYQGKLIVIVNELSQSQAEYTAMAFRAGDNTTIIGSTTAGADGNVSKIINRC